MVAPFFTTFADFLPEEIKKNHTETDTEKVKIYR